MDRKGTYRPGKGRRRIDHISCEAVGGLAVGVAHVDRDGVGAHLREEGRREHDLRVGTVVNGEDRKSS